MLNSNFKKMFFYTFMYFISLLIVFPIFFYLRFCYFNLFLLFLSFIFLVLFDILSLKLLSKNCDKNCFNCNMWNCREGELKCKK